MSRQKRSKRAGRAVVIGQGGPIVSAVQSLADSTLQALERGEREPAISGLGPMWRIFETVKTFNFKVVPLLRKSGQMLEGARIFSEANDLNLRLRGLEAGVRGLIQDIKSEVSGAGPKLAGAMSEQERQELQKGLAEVDAGADCLKELCAAIEELGNWIQTSPDAAWWREGAALAQRQSPPINLLDGIIASRHNVV